MSRSAANHAATHVNKTHVAMVALVKCSTLSALHAAKHARFLSSPAMTALYIAAIALANDKIHRNTSHTSFEVWLCFFYPAIKARASLPTLLITQIHSGL